MLRKDAGLTEIVNSMATENSEAAYKKLFQLLFKSLCGFSFCILKSAELAEEVASDTLFILWNRRAELPEVDNIRAYAFIIARNVSLNILKKELKKNTISMDEISLDVFLNHETPEKLFMSAELKRSLDETINLLPPRSKIVFKLIKEDGFSYKEVAEIMEISVKTVDAHLVTALKKISLIMNKEFKLI